MDAIWSTAKRGGAQRLADGVKMKQSGRVWGAPNTRSRLPMHNTAQTLEKPAGLDELWSNYLAGVAISDSGRDQSDLLALIVAGLPRYCDRVHHLLDLNSEILRPHRLQHSLPGLSILMSLVFVMIFVR